MLDLVISAGMLASSPAEKPQEVIENLLLAQAFKSRIITMSHFQLYSVYL